MLVNNINFSKLLSHSESHGNDILIINMITVSSTAIFHKKETVSKVRTYRMESPIISFTYYFIIPYYFTSDFERVIIGRIEITGSFPT